MKKYFIHNGEMQKGPFSIDELKNLGITSQSKVWFEGITEWTDAGKIAELKDFIVQSPPPFKKDLPLTDAFEKAKKIVDKDYVNEIEQHISNKTGKKVFKTSLIILSVIGLIFIINNLWPSKEKSNALDYLKIEKVELRFQTDYSYWGDVKDKYWLIEGKIINNATNTVYKDLELELEYFTYTKTSLGKQKVILYSIFRPNGTKENEIKYTDFKIKLNQNPPKDIYPFNTQFKILNAKIYEQDKASQ